MVDFGEDFPVPMGVAGQLGNFQGLDVLIKMHSEFFVDRPVCPVEIAQKP